MKTYTLRFVALFTLCFLPLNAEILIFSDNFNSTDSTDLNADAAGRQTGSIGTQSWTEDDNVVPTATAPEISANSLALISPAGGRETNVYLDFDFASTSGLLTAGGQFTVSFDLTAVSNYSSFYIGGGGLDDRPVIDGDTDFGILFNPGSIYQNGSTTLTTSGAGTSSRQYEITVNTTDFNNGTAYSLDLSVDGFARDLNGVAAGNALTGTWDGGPMIMGFSTRNGNTTIVDNFVVSAVIPEPSTFILMIGSLTLLLFIRHRA